MAEEWSNKQPEIKQLSEEVSYRISTSAIVASLEGAIRQLVDNSLDAGATHIDIRVEENGFKSFEVADNGSGIEHANFDRICKAHHTSKLTDLTGFENLTTLGFRGQALNALCALGSVTILTRSASSLLGTKMEFDHRGNQTNRCNIARQVGTTVLVDSLFSTLPVRRKEFEKTSKREFTKVLSCIQSFAFCRPDVKFICTNSVNGKKTQIICTPGTGAVKDVIDSLFGGSMDKTKMLELKRALPDEEICAIYGLDPSKLTDYDDLQFTGYISSCCNGSGRSSSDRQFVYVNQRPIEYAKVTSTANEMYKQYNKKQYPTLVFFILVPPSSIDVNVTPDKRTVFFDKEKQLLALFRASLKVTFEEVLATMNNTLENKVQFTSQGPETGQVPSVFDLLKDLGPSKKRGSSSLAGIVHKKNKIDGNKTLQDFSFKITPHSADFFDKSVAIREDSPEEMVRVKTTMGESNIFPTLTEENTNHVDMNNSRAIQDSNQTEIEQVEQTVVKVIPFGSQEFSNDTAVKTFSSTLLDNISRGLEVHHPRVDDQALDVVECRIRSEEPAIEKEIPTSELQSTETFYRPQQTVKFSVASFKKRLEQIKAQRRLKIEQASQAVDFTASADNKEEAEAELSRRLNKVDLEKMTIIGQFNKAFIITRLIDQLFIVDQHAADEKYNFERFQRKAKIDTQKLLSPQLLDFGRVQEMVIRDNLRIFAANGFEFDFKEDDNGCTRTYLVGFPVIYSRQFDKHDIDEIISVVREFPGQMYRPAKTRAIFASRACRKSVMIGTTLTVQHMQRIVHNLATLNQPWNCPHGRPTLRHLLNLTHFDNKLKVKK